MLSLNILYNIFALFTTHDGIPSDLHSVWILPNTFIKLFSLWIVSFHLSNFLMNSFPLPRIIVDIDDFGNSGLIGIPHLSSPTVPFSLSKFFHSCNFDMFDPFSIPHDEHIIPSSSFINVSLPHPLHTIFSLFFLG